MKRAAFVFFAVMWAVAVPMVGRAHNIGHFTLPDGSCHEVGSGKEAPIVGQDRTQLDLVPETPTPSRDEYGTSFVGFTANTPLHPGPCPIATVVSDDVDTTAVPAFATISFQ